MQNIADNSTAVVFDTNESKIEPPVLRTDNSSENIIGDAEQPSIAKMLAAQKLFSQSMVKSEEKIISPAVEETQPEKN